MKKTLARLAYDAFMLRVEHELVNLGIGGSNLKEEIKDFFTDLQKVFNTYRKETVAHGKVWRDVGIYIKKKIELAESFEDVERITKYRYFQEVYYDVDNEFVKREELSEDTVIA